MAGALVTKLKQAALKGAVKFAGNSLVKETLGPNLFALLSSNDPNDWRYRRITSPSTLRDLNPFMQQRMQQVSYYIKVTNPWAKQVVELIRTYVGADGFQVVCDSEAVQEVVDKFWNDKVNRLNSATAREWCEEKSTFGELCVPVAVNPTSGFVRVGYVDPMQIDFIEYGVLDTGNGKAQGVVSIPVAVHLKEIVGQRQAQRLEIIRPDEDPNSPTYGQLRGDCFFWTINKAKSASRGISDLFSLADWLDVFDQMTFDFADKVRFLNQYVWDYTFEGADKKQLDEFNKWVTQNPPKQGGTLVHNQQVKIAAVAPSFHGSDMSEAARVVARFGYGGMGLPPTFFGDGLEANRSTADEMTGPPGKKLTDRQNIEIECMSEVVEFVIDAAIAAGALSEKEDRGFKIQAPEVMTKDLQPAATAIQGIANAVALAEQNGWIRSETAARSFHLLLTEIGIEVDSGEEFDQAQQEKQARASNDAEAISNQKNLADALKGLQQTSPQQTGPEKVAPEPKELGAVQ